MSAVTAITFFYLPANAKVDYGRCEKLERGVRASEEKEEKLSPIKGCLIHTNRYCSGRLCLMREIESGAILLGSSICSFSFFFYRLFFRLIVYTLLNNYFNHVFWYP